MNDSIKMQISAFVDGELPQNEAELLLRRLCQDRELRQQAAEYLAVGRIMRGERSVAGIGSLRDRIAAELGDTVLEQEPGNNESTGPRFLRPLAGVAIAATVALAALVGIQQMSAGPDTGVAAGNTAIAESTTDSSYTVPDQDDAQLRDYYLRHSETSSHYGANSINARLVTLQLRDSVSVEAEFPELSEEEQPDDTTDVPVEDTP